jgi:hypothetical protein
LVYGNVTAYLDVAAQQYDVRLVTPGAKDCSTSLAGLPDFTNLPVLNAGVSATIAALGEVTPAAMNAFTLRAYVDDTTVDTGKTKLRFVHASPGTPAVDVGLGGGVLFTPVFVNVVFGAATTAGADSNGYIETNPIANSEISARADGTTTDILSIKPATLPAGAIATAFAIGKLGDATTPLQVLLCVDNGAPSGNLAACSQVGAAPQRAHVRVAHLSPDAPAVDVCLRQSGTTEYPAIGLLKSLGAPSGLAYPQITTYVDLPVQSYDVRIVLSTASDCTAAAVPDTKNLAVTNNLTATIAALGDLNPSGAAAGDPAFELKAFVDDTSLTPGMGKLRFIHASPGTPAVDIGLGTGMEFTKLYSNVAFSDIATGGSLDQEGYLETAPFANQTVTARLAGQSSDALSVSPVSLTAGTIATAFAIGGKTGATTNPLSVLLCGDNAAPVGLLSACSVVP